MRRRRLRRFDTPLLLFVAMLIFALLPRRRGFEPRRDLVAPRAVAAAGMLELKGWLIAAGSTDV